MLQGDTSTIANVKNQFLTHMKSEELIYDKFEQNRFEDYITLTHTLSYMLQPKYMGFLMTKKQQQGSGLITSIKISCY